MEQRLLTDAAFEGNLNVVKQLVEQGYDVNLAYDYGLFKRTPLDNAIENENLDVIKYLLENGAEVNRKSEFGTPLHHAIDIEVEEANRNYDRGKEIPAVATITELLLEFGADVNFKMEGGMTPLDEAIMRGHIHAERMLREHGAVTS